ncbi:hypothetical protein WA577_007459 [Blastocystis sp. JDR]
MSSTSTGVIRSIEHISTNLGKQKWNDVSQAYLSALEHIQELNEAAEILMGHYVVEPMKKDIGDIPSMMAAFFPKEKLEMDRMLEKSLNVEDYEYAKQIIDARNAWYDEMEKEINAYEEARKPKRRVVQ